MTINYQIEFFSYWHVSSGLSGGTYADSVVNKDVNGLPYIPGRTIKGLLRDAAELICSFSKDSLVSSSFIEQVFGVHPSKEDLENEKQTTASEVFFSNAELSNHLQRHLNNGLKKSLYKIHSATQIDENGLAVDHSLRQIEITAPLVLYGFIDFFNDSPENITQLRNCMKGVKRLGLNRTRGLGRCKFTLLNEQI